VIYASLLNKTSKYANQLIVSVLFLSCRLRVNSVVEILDSVLNRLSGYFNNEKMHCYC